MTTRAACRAAPISETALPMNVLSLNSSRTGAGARETIEGTSLLNSAGEREMIVRTRRCAVNVDRGTSLHRSPCARRHELGGRNELDGAAGEFCLHDSDRTIHIDPPAGIANHGCFKPRPARVQRRKSDTEVVGQPCEKEPPEAPLAAVAGEARRSGAVIFEKRRIRIYVPAEALAQDQLRLRQMQVGVQLGSTRALHAVIRPELLGVRSRQNFEWLPPGVAGREGA